MKKIQSLFIVVLIGLGYVYAYHQENAFLTEVANLQSINELALADGEGNISVTVPCWDNIETRPWHFYTKRECDLTTACAKVDCVSFSDEGKCTFSN